MQRVDETYTSVVGVIGSVEGGMNWSHRRFAASLPVRSKNCENGMAGEYHAKAAFKRAEGRGTRMS